VTSAAKQLIPAAVPDDALPLVTVIVPCRNELRFIRECLTSIVDNGYPLDRLQIIVVDGASTDGTPQVIADLATRRPCISLLHNPRQITPVALNIGVRAGRGDYILWMSAHNRYERGYVTECVRWALGTHADNVGGVIITAPRTAGVLADAITAALTHRFGVGGSSFRLQGGPPRWVDTVFGGCYRRDVFERIGLFNEALTRGQDMEFNLRLRRAGGRTLLVPTVRSTYFARTRLGDFLRHNWANGVWAILPFRHSSIVPVSPRHLVPLAFAAALTGTIAAAATHAGLRWLPLILLVPYGTASLVASAQVAWLRRAPRLLVVTPAVFAALHLSYGFGSLWALARSAVPLALRFVRGNRTPPRSAERRADGPG
jgi:glycosyltransferase involved in cell wall biosynthesis